MPKTPPASRSSSPVYRPFNHPYVDDLAKSSTDGSMSNSHISPEDLAFILQDSRRAHGNPTTSDAKPDNTETARKLFPNNTTEGASKSNLKNSNTSSSLQKEGVNRASVAFRRNPLQPNTQASKGAPVASNTLSSKPNANSLGVGVATGNGHKYLAGNVAAKRSSLASTTLNSLSRPTSSKSTTDFLQRPAAPALTRTSLGAKKTSANIAGSGSNVNAPSNQSASLRLRRDGAIFLQSGAKKKEIIGSSSRASLSSNAPLVAPAKASDVVALNANASGLSPIAQKENFDLLSNTSFSEASVSRSATPNQTALQQTSGSQADRREDLTLGLLPASSSTPLASVISQQTSSSSANQNRSTNSASIILPTSKDSESPFSNNGNGVVSENVINAALQSQQDTDSAIATSPTSLETGGEGNHSATILTLNTERNSTTPDSESSAISSPRNNNIVDTTSATTAVAPSSPPHAAVNNSAAGNSSIIRDNRSENSFIPIATQSLGAAAGDQLDNNFYAHSPEPLARARSADTSIGSISTPLTRKLTRAASAVPSSSDAWDSSNFSANNNGNGRIPFVPFNPRVIPSKSQATGQDHNDSLFDDHALSRLDGIFSRSKNSNAENKSSSGDGSYDGENEEPQSSAASVDDDRDTTQDLLQQYFNLQSSAQNQQEVLAAASTHSGLLGSASSSRSSPAGLDAAPTLVIGVSTDQLRTESQPSSVFSKSESDDGSQGSQPPSYSQPSNPNTAPGAAAAAIRGSDSASHSNWNNNSFIFEQPDSIQSDTAAASLNGGRLSPIVATTADSPQHSAQSDDEHPSDATSPAYTFGSTGIDTSGSATANHHRGENSNISRAATPPTSATTADVIDRGSLPIDSKNSPINPPAISGDQFHNPRDVEVATSGSSSPAKPFNLSAQFHRTKFLNPAPPYSGATPQILPPTSQESNNSSTTAIDKTQRRASFPNPLTRNRNNKVLSNQRNATSTIPSDLPLVVSASETILTPPNQHKSNLSYLSYDNYVTTASNDEKPIIHSENDYKRLKLLSEERLRLIKSFFDNLKSSKTVEKPIHLEILRITLIRNVTQVASTVTSNERLNVTRNQDPNSLTLALSHITSDDSNSHSDLPNLVLENGALSSNALNLEQSEESFTLLAKIFGISKEYEVEVKNLTTPAAVASAASGDDLDTTSAPNLIDLFAKSGDDNTIAEDDFVTEDLLKLQPSHLATRSALKKAVTSSSSQLSKSSNIVNTGLDGKNDSDDESEIRTATSSERPSLTRDAADEEYANDFDSDNSGDERKNTELQKNFRVDGGATSQLPSVGASDSQQRLGTAGGSGNSLSDHHEEAPALEEVTVGDAATNLSDSNSHSSVSKPPQEVGGSGGGDGDSPSNSDSEEDSYSGSFEEQEDEKNGEDEEYEHDLHPKNEADIGGDNPQNNVLGAPSHQSVNTADLNANSENYEEITVASLFSTSSRTGLGSYIFKQLDESKGGGKPFAKNNKPNNKSTVELKEPTTTAPFVTVSREMIGGKLKDIYKFSDELPAKTESVIARSNQGSKDTNIDGTESRTKITFAKDDWSKIKVTDVTTTPVKLIEDEDQTRKTLTFFHPVLTPRINSDRFDFSTTSSEVVKQPLSKSQELVNSALEKARNEAGITPEQAAKLILIAIKNGGVNGARVQLEEDLRTVGEEGAESTSANPLTIQKAIKFSKVFQDTMSKTEMFTGNQEYKNLVGMRLKRLTPDYALNLLRNRTDANEKNSADTDFDKMWEKLDMKSNFFNKTTLPSQEVQPKSAEIVSSQNTNHH